MNLQTMIQDNDNGLCRRWSKIMIMEMNLEAVYQHHKNIKVQHNNFGASPEQIRLNSEPVTLLLHIFTNYVQATNIFKPQNGIQGINLIMRCRSEQIDCGNKEIFIPHWLLK